MTVLQGDASRAAEDGREVWSRVPGRGFDAILLGNLVCRLSQPLVALQGLASLLNPGGTLLITSPFSWKQEFTPKDLWLGGRDERGSVALQKVRAQ